LQPIDFLDFLNSFLKKDFHMFFNELKTHEKVFVKK